MLCVLSRDCSRLSERISIIRTSLAECCIQFHVNPSLGRFVLMTEWLLNYHKPDGVIGLLLETLINMEKE